MPQASFAILYMYLFLFMIIYLLAKLKTPNNLDYNTKETYTPHATASSHSIFKGLRTDIILFCFLAIATIKLTYSIETVMDIDFGGAHYLYRGTRLIRHGLPSAKFAPLFFD